MFTIWNVFIYVICLRHKIFKMLPKLTKTRNHRCYKRFFQLLHKLEKMKKINMILELCFYVTFWYLDLNLLYDYC